MAAAWWAVLHRRPGAAAHWARSYGLAVGVHALWNGTNIVAAVVAGAWFQDWEVDVLGLADGAMLLALLAAMGVALAVALRALARRLEPADEAGVLARPVALPAERAIALWALFCLVVLVPVGLGVLRAMF